MFLIQNCREWDTIVNKMSCYFRRCSQERKLVMRWRVVFIRIGGKATVLSYIDGESLEINSKGHLIHIAFISSQRKETNQHQRYEIMWGWSKGVQPAPDLLWSCLLKWNFSEKSLKILDLKSSVTSKLTCFVFVASPAKSCCNYGVKGSRWKVHTTCDDRWAKKSPRQLKGDTFGSPKRSQEWKGFTLPPGSAQTVSFYHTKCSVFGKWQ